MQILLQAVETLKVSEEVNGMTDTCNKKVGNFAISVKIR